tara:strand:- start:6988 stop:7317 length:330 start_codon:yes stop_codon:yes gene_type:complete
MNYSKKDKIKYQQYNIDLNFYNEKLQGTAEAEDEPYFKSLKDLIDLTNKNLTKLADKYKEKLPANKCIYCGKTIRKYSKWEEKANRKTHYKCWKRERPFEWRHLDKYII